MIDDVSECLKNLEARQSMRYLTSYVELLYIFNLFTYWYEDPMWPKIQKAMKNPFNFEHTVVKLAYAKKRIDFGYDVRLNREQDDQRNADLLVESNEDCKLAIEVKAPRRLQWHYTPLTELEAQKIVEDKWKNARAGNGGQLNGKQLGCLLIGGHSFCSNDLELLKNAAKRLLAKKSEGRDHIIGITFQVFLLLCNNIDFSPQGLIQHSDASLEGMMVHRFIRNPGYCGPLVINEGGDNSPLNHAEFYEIQTLPDDRLSIKTVRF